jgi:O-antigen ligase
MTGARRRFVPTFHGAATAAVATLVAVEASNVSTIVGKRGGLSLYLVALAIATGFLAVGVLTRRIRPVWSPVFLLFAVYVAARAASVFTAFDPALAWTAVGEDAKRLVYLVVVATLLAALAGEGVVSGTLVTVIALLAGLSLVQEFALSNATTFGGLSQVPIGEDLGGTTARHSGPYGEADVVGWGKAQVLILPVALSLCAVGPRRWRWVAAALAIAGGIYLTQSRGAYLALGFAVVVWLVAAGRRYARLLRFAPLVLLVALLIPGVGSRLATLGALQEATVGGGGDASLVERVAVQRDALEMFAQRPNLGVGAGNFLVAQPDFQRESGLVVARPLVVHNSYLQVAAEGGAIGLAGWLLFYGAALFVAYRALILFRRMGADELGVRGRWLAVGVLGGLAGFALATLFVPLNQVRTLLSLVAVGAALDIRARREARRRERDGAPLPPGRSARERGRQVAARPAVRAAGAFVLLAVAGAILLPLRERPVWVADVSAAVVPRVQDRSAASAYEYDLLSRGTLVPTYAAIVADARGPTHGSRVRVSSAPVAALIVVSAGSADRAVAERTAREVLDRGRTYVASAGGRYVLVPVDAPAAVTRRPGPLLPGRLALLLGVCAAVAAGGYGLSRARAGRARRVPEVTR